MAGTALILGARNLGGAIAEHLAVAGWNVAAVARSDETVERVRERLPNALAVAADAADPGRLAAVVEQTRERFGSLELVVNAVSPGPRTGGTFGGGPLVEASPEDVDHYMTGVARQVFAFLSVGARALRAEEAARSSRSRGAPRVGPSPGEALGPRARSRPARSPSRLPSSSARRASTPPS